MNLLPKQQRDILHKDILARFLFAGFVVCSLWAVIFLVSAYNIIWYLSIQSSALSERLEQEQRNETSKSLTLIEKDIAELNATLSQIQRVRAKTPPDFSALLRTLGGLVPSGVRFENVAFHGDSLAIAGHADTRAEAIALKEGLEKDSLCKDVNSPILVKEKDLDFNFSCSLHHGEH